MNSRLKHLHSNKLVTALTGLEEDAAAFKGATQLTGADVVYTVSTNPTAYDWTGTISPGSSNAVWFLVTLTGEPGTVLYCSVAAAISVDGFASRYTMADFGSDLVALDMGGSLGPVEPSVWRVPNSGGQGANINQGQIELQVAGATARTVWMKVYASALQPVTLTVTPL